MEPIIQPMTPAHWGQVSHIYRQGILTDLATFTPVVPPYEAWDRGHIPDMRFVYIQDDVVLGWMALAPTSARAVYDGVAEISLYIHQDHQGKGIATALMQFILTHAQTKGYWTLQSIIFRDNTTSITLHENHGFRMVGYREKIAKDRHGVWRDTVLMEKRFS